MYVEKWPLDRYAWKAEKVARCQPGKESSHQPSIHVAMGQEEFLWYGMLRCTPSGNVATKKPRASRVQVERSVELGGTGAVRRRVQRAHRAASPAPESTELAEVLPRSKRRRSCKLKSDALFGAMVCNCRREDTDAPNITHAKTPKSVLELQ